LPEVKARRAYAAWLAVCVFWSTTFLAIRIAVESFPPLVMTGTRYLVAGVVLAGIVVARGIPLPPRTSWPGHALLGALMLGVGNGALVWAEQWVPSGVAAVMVAAIPFWMVGVEATLPSGERIRLGQFVGLLLGFAGIIFLASLASANLGMDGSAGRQFLHGVIALQLSCCGWALGSAYSKRHARQENAIAAAATQMAFGGAMLMLAGTLLGEWHGVHVTERSGLAFVYLIIFGSIVGYASYIYALKHLPVTTVSLYAYVTPIGAIMLGAFVLSEPFTARMAVAIGIIFLGMLVVRKNADTSRSSPGPA
jgi:drug/metabolite transporter (DMT)-like permease